MKKISKIKTGIVFGIIAGVIDVIPMIFQELTWDAILSAFSLWVIAGFMIATSNLKIGGASKGFNLRFTAHTFSGTDWLEPTGKFDSNLCNDSNLG